MSKMDIRPRRAGAATARNRAERIGSSLNGLCSRQEVLQEPHLTRQRRAIACESNGV
jgi:hypothetical protein